MTQLQTAVRKGYEGTAIATALGGSWLGDNKSYGLDAHIGGFRGETAFGNALLRVSSSTAAQASASIKATSPSASAARTSGDGWRIDGPSRRTDFEVTASKIF